MQRHQCPVLRPVSCFPKAAFLKAAIFIPVAVAMLLVAPAARTESANGPNPDNVLVMPKSAGGAFGRWTTTRAAAPRTTQRPQRARNARAKKPIEPVAAQAAPAAPQTAETAWPNAAAAAGGALLVPITVKTVREMATPDPDKLLFENELSDIDLAARPLLAAAPATPAPAATDGRAAAENDATEQPRIYAMAETMKAITQWAWLEPVLLVLAGALAALSAVRLFA